MSTPRSQHPGYLVLAEVALVLVSAAILYSFVRLFDGTAFLVTLVPVVVFTHATTILMRRTGVGLGMTTVVSVLGFALLSTWLWFPETSTALLPTPSTWSAFNHSLQAAWVALDQLTTPVPAQSGFLVIGGFVLFCAIFLADWAAFRLWSPLEALVGYLALYLFGVMLGTQNQQVATAVALATSVCLFLLAFRALRLSSESSWLASRGADGRPRPGTGAAMGWLVRLGVPVMVLAVALGTIVGPALPGTGDAALVDWREEREQSNRIVVSPLVEIRDRLVNQSDAEAFTVESPQPAYWRLTALDTFDGEIWRSSGRYAEANGALDATVPDSVGGDQILQRFQIANLRATWLPAAFQPLAVEVTGSDTVVRYQDSSSTLIVDNDVPSSDDLTYDVVSQVPRPTAEQLARTELSVPGELSHQLDLPDSLSPAVRSLAEEVADQARATTPYARALALQSFFRDEGVFASDDHEFTYVLGTAQGGHGGDAVVQFLESGRGYCEQFAGTYAAMARVLGLPARVAVGFTWGEPDPQDPGRFTVRGRHAHAWPEVWLGSDVGWVAFEPTPGRGAPTMGDYAGIAPSQASAGGRSGGTEPLDEQLLPPQVPQDQPSEPSQQGPEEARSDDLLSSISGTEGTPARWPLALGIAGVGILAILGLYMLGAPALMAWARRRRRAMAGDRPGARVMVAWEDSEESMALLGVVREPSETHGEFAKRAAGALASQAENIGELAATSEVAAYSADGPSTVATERAEQVADEIGAEARRSASRSRRLRAELDPRSIWASLRQTFRHRS